MPPFVEVVTHRLAGRREPGEITRGWSLTLFAAWLVIYPIGALLEPAPANPDAGSPVLITLLGLVLLGAWAVAANGLARRRRVGATASLVAAGCVIIAAAACPASSHHTIGAWWYAQMAGAFTLAGLSALARA